MFQSYIKAIFHPLYVQSMQPGCSRPLPAGDLGWREKMAPISSWRPAYKSFPITAWHPSMRQNLRAEGARLRKLSQTIQKNTQCKLT